MGTWTLSLVACLSLGLLMTSCRRSRDAAPAAATLSVSVSSTSQSVAEDAGPITLSVELTGALERDVSIPFTTLGSATHPDDFTIDASPLVIPAGQLTGDIQIMIVDDTAVEVDETIEVTLETPVNAVLGASAVHITTILDNDAQPVTVGLTRAAQSIAEGGETAMVTALLSAVSPLDVQLPFSVQGSATAPSDYMIDASPLVIPAGQTSGSLLISIENDSLLEPNETIEVTLGTPVNATLAGTTIHTLTILDDDALQLAGTRGSLLVGVDPATAETTRISDTTPALRYIQGLAFDSNTGTLYGVDSSTDELIVLDRTTGLTRVVGATGFSDVESLAFDPNTNTLYGVDNFTDALISIDTSTGAGTLIGVHGFASVLGLAFDPGRNRLYGTNVAGLALFDTTTGAAIRIGSTGFQFIAGLTFDTLTGTLYGTRQTVGTTSEFFRINTGSGLATLVTRLGSESAGFAFDPSTNEILGADLNQNQLVAINPRSASESYVGPQGQCPANDLAFDSNSDTLYGINRLGNLIRIDPATGDGTEIGFVFGSQFPIQGLAFDPLTNTLFGTETRTGRLVRIDPVTASGTIIGSMGIQEIEGLAFDPNSNTLYGTDTQQDMLVVIDTATGAATVVGALGFRELQGLAFDPVSNSLFGTSTFTDELVLIDPVSGAGTAIGPLQEDRVRGLAFDPNTNTLFGHSGALLVIDTATGLDSTAQFLCDSSISGLAFDPNTNTIYGTDTFTDQLLTIDAATGEASRFGKLGFEHVASLAFDPNANALYGVDTSLGSLVLVDTVTGSAQATDFMPLGFSSVVGLAFDPSTNTLYGADSDTDQLITINTITGFGTAIGPFGFEGVEGLGFDAFSNTLYGTNSGANGGTGELIMIDTMTGAGSVVGSTMYWLFGLTGPALER